MLLLTFIKSRPGRGLHRGLRLRRPAVLVPVTFLSGCHKQALCDSSCSPIATEFQHTHRKAGFIYCEKRLLHPSLPANICIDKIHVHACVFETIANAVLLSSLTKITANTVMHSYHHYLPYSNDGMIMGPYFMGWPYTLSFCTIKSAAKLNLLPSIGPLPRLGVVVPNAPCTTSGSYATQAR